MPARLVGSHNCVWTEQMINHNIVKSKNYVYISITESPELDVFLQASRLVVNDPDFTANMHRLCDFSQADLSNISPSGYREYGEFAVKNIPIDENAKLALVSPDPDKRGVFEQFAERVQSGKVRFFDQPEDAVMWIVSG